MNSATLQWNPEKHGFRFQLLENFESPVKIEQWGLYDVALAQGTGSVGPLLSLYNDGLTEGSETEVLLTHTQIAQLDDIEVKQLGLPPVAPFRLQVRGKGQLARKGFGIDYKLLTTNGPPTLGLERQGTLCVFARKQYLLLDPLYSLVTGIENFQNQSFFSVDDQMVAWGRLQELLPDNAIVDNQLRTVNIVRADQFTLDIQGTSDFSPILLHTEGVDNEESEKLCPALPEARSKGFSDQFSRRSQVCKHYALGSGWYVVIPAKLQAALQVVRREQSKEPAERKAFLANPASYIREELLKDDYTDDQEKEIETIFVETKEFLSDRIRCLGIWEPKLCAYRLPTNNVWLPEEDIPVNVQLGNSIYELSKADVEKLLFKIQEAQKKGALEVDINGKKYPVNNESIQALERLIPKNKIAPGEEKSSTSSDAPILKDNIEEQNFLAEKRNVRGEAGGLPANLKTQPLYPHQEDGLFWLQTHWAQGNPGVLLADDMGLGKTLQALVFMAWVAESMVDGSYKRKPFLVVAPTGLLKNWLDEAKIHFNAPGLGRKFEAFGPGLRKFQNMTLLQRRERFTSVDWVLTTYETLRDKIKYFLPVEWGITIFDEAQKIKNPVSRITEMAKSLENDFTLILTGTPVENELKDLWCIMDTAAPGFLGSLKKFHSTFAKPAQNDPNVAIKLQKRLLKDTTPSMMLRRMKADHLQGLPRKHVVVLKKAMSPFQAGQYSAIVQQAAVERGEQGAILKALQRMRNCSLFASEVTGEGLTDSLISESARLSATIEILDKIHDQNEKALIFLESLKLQELLIPYLQKRYSMQRPPLRISGKDVGASRKKHVDIFQSGPPDSFDVMILSPKAGGVGLTLTAANHVVHLSRWWNPAVEDQCTDRIFRIGQQKPIHVYYPLAIHPKFGEASFDVNLHNMLDRKRELSRQVLVPNTIGVGDYKELFGKSIPKASRIQ